MAFEPKDYLVGAGCLGTIITTAGGVVAIVGMGLAGLTLGSAIWYGAQVKGEVATGTTRILGEDVSYRVLQRNWFGKTVLLCKTDGVCVPHGSYMDYLETIVDDAESKILEK